MPIALDTFVLDMDSTSQMIMSGAIFGMMLAVALGLKPQDFLFIKKSPRLYMAGLLGQVLVLPVITIALCWLLSPHPSIAIGMILIACCPGGNVSNILVLLSRGNTALSVSLTATSSLLAAFVTPSAILFWTSIYPPTADVLTQIDLDVVGFLLHTGLILAVPLFIGMLTANYLPRLAQSLRGPLVVIASLMLASIILVTVFKARDLLVVVGGAIIGIVALHNAIAYLSGFCLGRLVKADTASTRALTIEIGIQNSGLGIVIIMSQFGGVGAAAAVAGLWGIWHILAGMVLVSFFRVSDKLSNIRD